MERCRYLGGGMGVFPGITDRKEETIICCSCCSVSQSCLPLCDPMDYSMPGFPVLHYLPEFAQTRVHWVGDAIQPPHPLSPPSLPALNLSQHQRLLFSMSWLFVSGGQSIGASVSVPVLPMTIQGWFPLGLTGFISFVQGTLKSLLQHHSLKASVLQHPAFFMV